MTCGIYSIINKSNGKIYVGQSISIEKRFTQHKWKLNTHTHENEHLQNAWNEYGENSFEFSIVECCSKSLLNESEKWWIEYFQSANRKYGYNKESGGKSGMIVSKDTSLKISNANTKTGLYRVSKIDSLTCRQGFFWMYKYTEKETEKTISSVSLFELKEKVLSKGLEWLVIDVEKAEKCFEHHYNIDGRIQQKNNLSGYYRVGKMKNRECKKGFAWRYSYTENGKRKSIVSVSLSKLKNKVLMNGLEWRILDEEKARISDAL